MQRTGPEASGRRRKIITGTKPHGAVLFWKTDAQPMNSLRQISFRLGEILRDLGAAAFAALAWIEEGDGFASVTAGPRPAASRVPRKQASRPLKSRQPQWPGPAGRWVM
jgi:hypothetical protein